MADTNTQHEQEPRLFTARPRASRRPRVPTPSPAPRRGHDERDEPVQQVGDESDP